jgi:hypothetical protein
MTDPSGLPRDLLEAFADADARPSRPCPPADDIWAAARGEADPAAARQVALHVAECGACTTAWRLAVEMTGVVPAADTGRLSETTPLARWRRIASVGTVAALAAGLAGLFVIDARRFPVRSDTGVYRTAAPAEVRALVPDAAVLPRDGVRLRWTPGPTGSRYTVRVFTEDLTRVAEAVDLTTPEYLVPESRLVGLPDGARLLWQVIVATPDGEVFTSPTFTVRLR